MGSRARQEYMLDNFKVSLEESGTRPSRTVTDDMFADGSALLKMDPFLFDAYFTFMIAINSLLNKGHDLTAIKDGLLLNELKNTEFEGISGIVAFNENGDRDSIGYELLNYQPTSSGTSPEVVGRLDAREGKLILDELPYWMDGTRSSLPPKHLTACSPGFYKEQSSNQCKLCPRGMYCPGPEKCPKSNRSYLFHL